MRIVVTVPTYNEKENIEAAIKNILAQSKSLTGYDLHVIVSDSHSPDVTAEIVKKISQTNPKVHYLDVKVRGLGIGLVKGHRYAIDKLKADILAQMDGDLSHDPSTLPQMVKYIEEGYDLVNGSRLTKGGHNLLGWHRRLFTNGSSIYSRFAWGAFKLTEFTTSYRVFTKELFGKIDFSKVSWKSKTYIVQPTFLYAAIKAGAKIKEVPITFVDRKAGYSKAKIVNYILDVLIFGLKVRLEKSKTFIKFLFVGGQSYFVNAIALGLLNRGQIYSLKVLSMPLLGFIPTIESAPKIYFLHIDRLFVASLISIELSIIYNFIWHDNWTFKSRERHGSFVTRLVKFNLSSLASPIIQLVCILVAVRVFNLNEQIGLAVGVLIGLFFNYAVNMLWIWKAHPPKTSPQAVLGAAKEKAALSPS